MSIESKDKVDASSPFTIGTLYGLAIPLYAPRFWAVRRNKVIETRQPDRIDYFQPCAYVLPSIAMYSWQSKASKTESIAVANAPVPHLAGGTLSIILPAGLTVGADGNKNLSVGLGLSVGWSGAKGAEVGFSAAVVWTAVPYLSDAQNAAFRTGADLPAGADSTIDTRLKPAFAFGVYVAPTF